MGSLSIRSVSPILLLLAAFLTAGCGKNPPPKCDGGLQSYKDACLSQATVEYMQCTANRGFDVDTEINTSVGASFKAVTDASLTVAYKKAQKEDSPVALQIVKTCADLANNSSVTAQERGQLASFQQQVDMSMKDFEKESLNSTASIKISKSSARVGDKVTVEGIQFQANEIVDINVDVRAVTRVTADSRGSFKATITIPGNILVHAPSHYVVAIGHTSARSDHVPITITA